MPKHQVIAEALGHIFKGINHLNAAFPNRRFTIDGRLVGDIGEVIAAPEYDLVLDAVQRPDYDAITSDGRKVQIKATFKKHLTFSTVPDYYLGFKLDENGDYEEIFNGPGKKIREHYSRRKNIGLELLSFSISELRELSKTVHPNDRIPKRIEQAAATLPPPSTSGKGVTG